MAVTVSPNPPEASLAFGLDEARLAQWEQPAWALSVAVRSQERAHTLGAVALEARSLVLQASLSMHRGDLRGAYELAAEAETRTGADPVARAELAALYGHLHYFSGSYAEALRHAEEAIALADATDDRALRIHARRMGCVAFGNLGVASLGERMLETLALTIEAESPWEETICRNDLACFSMELGEMDEARDQLERALTIARGIEHNSLIMGVLHSTRADMHLRHGEPADARRDAVRSISHLTAKEDINPYLLGMTVLVLVQALVALGEHEEARRAGEAALSQLGDRVPQARSMILSAVAEALRTAGRAEEAYELLSRGMALAQEALEQFSLLQVGLDRARLQTASARRQAETLAEKNRRLELVVDSLRDEASRDPLTGLHNRRHLARVYWPLTVDPDRPISLAVTDIDHFKSVNDRFGHGVGDQVLVRFAELLVEHLRGEDVVVRTGGEEFAILMPGTDEQVAAVICERLRGTVESEDWERLAPGLTLSASFGIASALGRDDLDVLTRRADDRLYEAKRAGRNRVG